MKNNKVGIFIGFIFIFVAIGAYLSDEALSQTSQGKFVIIGCIIFGLFTITKNLNTKK